jgi:hypothetical protein
VASMLREGGGIPINGRTADANRGSLAKGGEEKSPYSPNFSTTASGILDAECTIALLLFDNVDRLEIATQLSTFPKPLHEFQQRPAPLPVSLPTGQETIQEPGIVQKAPDRMGPQDVIVLLERGRTSQWRCAPPVGC